MASGGLTDGQRSTWDAMMAVQDGHRLASMRELSGILGTSKTRCHQVVMRLAQLGYVVPAEAAGLSPKGGAWWAINPAAPVPAPRCAARPGKGRRKPVLSDPLSIGLQAKVDAAIEAIQTLANRMSKGDRDLADELFQIGYMAAVRAARNYDVHDGGCFEDFAMTWAASMMKQELIYRQAKGADGKRNFSLVLDHRVEIEGSGFPAERDDEVRRLVLALPIVKREIVMRRMRGESIEAIAISIGMSHDRVAEIETEAHDQLRGRLAKYA